MSTETILLIVLVVLLIGALPSWPHSRSWGYGPSSVMTALLVMALVWFFFVKDGNARLGNDSLDVGSSINDLGRDVKEAGRDLKRTAQDAVD